MVLERDRYLCQCEKCKSSGNARPGTEVDHIVPRAQGGTSEMSNLRAINTECHKVKTQVEIGNRPRTAVGVDGWPVEANPAIGYRGGYVLQKKR